MTTTPEPSEEAKALVEEIRRHYVSERWKQCHVDGMVAIADRHLEPLLAAAKKDYEGMREMQGKFIAKSHEADALRAEVERMKAWADGLQSSMYVNCVYCGYRYCSLETGDPMYALKAHVETCKHHPMNALREKLADAEKREGEWRIAAKEMWEELCELVESGDRETQRVIEKHRAALISLGNPPMAPDDGSPPRDARPPL